MPWWSRKKKPEPGYPAGEKNKKADISIAGIDLEIFDHQGRVVIRALVKNGTAFEVLTEAIEDKLIPGSNDSAEKLFKIRANSNPNLHTPEGMPQAVIFSTATSNRLLEFDDVQKICEELQKELTPEVLAGKIRAKEYNYKACNAHQDDMARIRLADRETAKYLSAVNKCLEKHGIEVSEDLAADLRTALISAYAQKTI